ncbi:MAG: TetR/AcrR family transcriptional regulator [Desulfobacterales bacterium]|nr:TetR/AcrR family transcriptional regulator [Desulfobacterales bacterium]
MGRKQTAVPKQKRGIETRKKIKDTAYQLYASKGYHNTSSNEIASVAGVNIGTFYNYFEDKKQLLLELIEDFQVRFFEATFSTKNIPDLSGADLKDLISHYVNQSFNAFRKDRAFFKNIYPLQYIDKDVEKIFRKYERLEARQAVSIFRQRMGAMDKEEIESQVNIVVIIIAAISNRFYTLGLPTGKKQIIQVMTQMISSYLESSRFLNKTD